MPDWLYYIYVKARRESQIVLENMKLGLVSIVTSGLRFFFSAELCWRMRNGMWSFKSSLTRWFCLNTLGFWQSLPSAYLEIFAVKNFVRNTMLKYFNNDGMFRAFTTMQCSGNFRSSCHANGTWIMSSSADSIRQSSTEIFHFKHI